MLNIIDLENRWVKYKIKSYIPHITIVVSLLIITLLLIIFTTTETRKSSEAKAKKVAIPITKKVEITPKKTVSQEILKPIKEEKTVVTKVKKREPIVARTSQYSVKSEKQVKLSPSLDFMREMQHSVQPYYMNENSTPEIEENKDVKVATPVQVKVVQKHPKVVTQAETTSDSQTHKITIRRENTKNDIYEIIKRFKKNNNPALSLFVAKKYYQRGNYDQAYNYALLTNQINNQIDASWIIFAKSLVKLGKKGKAIKTLTEYVNYSHSNSAKILLDDIKLGKFQ